MNESKNEKHDEDEIEITYFASDHNVYVFEYIFCEKWLTYILTAFQVEQLNVGL